MERARRRPAVLRGASSSVSMRTVFICTSPSATSKRAGKPSRNFLMMPWRSMPMTPPCGPVMPTSVM
jgi:hypothetical protein